MKRLKKIFICIIGIIVILLVIFRILGISLQPKTLLNRKLKEQDSSYVQIISKFKDSDGVYLCKTNNGLLLMTMSNHGLIWKTEKEYDWTIDEISHSNQVFYQIEKYNGNSIVYGIVNNESITTITMQKPDGKRINYSTECTGNNPQIFLFILEETNLINYSLVASDIDTNEVYRAELE